ncbi:MAG: hypothetical protein ACKVHH_06445 [Candidatus Poseidoniales archaeon]|jgi:hypothetical protein
MAEATLEILGYARWFSLAVCFAIGAWLDNRDRRIPNEHWIAWSKPLIFIWGLELMIRSADWTIWASALAALSFASVSLIGRPTIDSILKGEKMDVAVALCYLIGAAGVIFGAIKYAPGDALSLLNGSASEQRILWFEVMLAFAMVIVFEFAWRLRLLHGGADAKALMWVALIMPSWVSLAPFFQPSGVVNSTPPVLSLFIWGGLAFLFLPLILLLLNIKNGNLKSFKDLQMAWHSVRMPLDMVQEKHVWLMDQVIEKPDGSVGIKSRTRAPRRTPSAEELAEQVDALIEKGAISAWVSPKLPLITMFFPAIIPLFLFGDPIAFAFALFG